MQLGLENAVALVTGASGNIGVATCDALRREGVRVIATDIAGRTGGTADEWRTLDVTRENEWRDLIAGIRADHGRLDILVNNAGIAIMDRLEDMPLADWTRTQDINVAGIFLGLKTAVPLMRESGANRAGGASMINVASGAADKPAAFSAAYCASKAAVAMLTRAAAIEFAALGYPVRVNSVHPGAVESEMIDGIIARYSALTGGTPIADLHAAMLKGHPMGRLVLPDDVADTIVFLASTASRYTHGDALHIDGGHAAT
ncbi:SDR family NAD(P)-dependent oxidoreductase [Sphingomonas profundi]|uniref:SDR family NAD(P)-dependent oxidoreductase n=1 Tax=Alterirhizorhabdus profundi TaxID=2681549 RepID=UPI0012E889F5|nr:SDR family oxidoreductase [Sphingomonas profundi]